MKKYYGILCLLVLSILSCSKYDDSEIWDYVKEMNSRLTALEEKCREMNTNISSLQTIVSAAENGDYITNVAPITKDGKTIGYTISFKKADPITIYNGKDGTNGYTPVIAVKKDTDGLYYWTIEGEWLLDDNGNKVQASATNGTNGENGTTPQLKIDNEYWYVSYDSGATWQMLGKATGEKGEDGKSLFSSVEIGENDVIFILCDGTSFRVPLNFYQSTVEYEAVDLGLPSGTLWATCNVGAKNPEEYGNFFAWGDTKLNNVFSLRLYKFYSGTGNAMIRYLGYPSDSELEPRDDTATVNWGDEWQIPSRAQFEELIENTTKKWTTKNDIDGILITSTNGNSIFLPAAGCSCVSESDNREYNESGTIRYWSRSVREDQHHEAYAFWHDYNSYFRVIPYPRYFGLSVRPVRKQ